MLGEDEDWLGDIATEMDQADGLIWLYGVGEESIMAFTDCGIETLTDLIQIYKADPHLLNRSTDQSEWDCGLRRMLTVLLRSRAVVTWNRHDRTGTLCVSLWKRSSTSIGTRRHL